MCPVVVCVEGPSAVGKTTLAAMLAHLGGTEVVPELDGRSAPASSPVASWFVDRHVELWQLARVRAAQARFGVLDGDPLKGLWYDWVFPRPGEDVVTAVAPLYRAHIARGTLAFPELYVVLQASEEQLRERRAGDHTRMRRGFERHLRLVHPQRRYFAALRRAAPHRVAFIDSTVASRLVDQVLAAIAQVPGEPPDSAVIFEHMVEWIRRSSPEDSEHEAEGDRHELE